MPNKSKNKKTTNLVQKSTPLTSLISSDLNLFEFKILDIYLSKIDSHNPNERKVTFSKDELQSVLGVVQIKPTELNEKLKQIMSRVLEIRDGRKEKGFTLLNLFSRAECEKDEKGDWMVQLSCSHEAKEYIFNVETLGYLRYRLKSVSKLSSLYSYKLFLYIERNKFRRSWNVTIDDLRQILGCGEESYSDYKKFNARILKQAQTELSLKSGLEFTYTPIRYNRKIHELQFTVVKSFDTLYNSEVQEVNISEDNEDATETKNINNDELTTYLNEEFYPDMIEACENEFTRSQIESILDILLGVDLPVTMMDEEGDHFDRAFKRFTKEKYLSSMYKRLKAASDSSEIKNRFAYFKKMIEKDAEKRRNINA